MYKFHYDYVLKAFNAKLLFTDTDSLFYEISDSNVYEQCFKDRKLFDFSGYPDYYDSSNKKILGKMKDKFSGVKISQFVGLKSKMYSLTSVDDREVKANRIQSELHEIGIYDINKISLSCFDDKRYVFDDAINTLAYIHKDIL